MFLSTVFVWQPNYSDKYVNCINTNTDKTNQIDHKIVVTSFSVKWGGEEVPWGGNKRHWLTASPLTHCNLYLYFSLDTLLQLALALLLVLQLLLDTLQLALVLVLVLQLLPWHTAACTLNELQCTAKGGEVLTATHCEMQGRTIPLPRQIFPSICFHCQQSTLKKGKSMRATRLMRDTFSNATNWLQSCPFVDLQMISLQDHMSTKNF